MTSVAEFKLKYIEYTYKLPQLEIWLLLLKDYETFVLHFEKKTDQILIKLQTININNIAISCNFSLWRHTVLFKLHHFVRMVIQKVDIVFHQYFEQFQPIIHHPNVGFQCGLLRIVVQMKLRI